MKPLFTYVNRLAIYRKSNTVYLFNKRNSRTEFNIIIIIHIPLPLEYCPSRIATRCRNRVQKQEKIKISEFCRIKTFIFKCECQNTFKIYKSCATLKTTQFSKPVCKWLFFQKNQTIYITWSTIMRNTIIHHCWARNRSNWHWCCSSAILRQWRSVCTWASGSWGSKGTTYL